MALTKYFDKIPEIRYEGPDSDNPFAYRWYDPDHKVAGTTLREWTRFAVCYWHTFRGTGADPFGPGTIQRPWEDGTDSVAMAVKRADVVFDFVGKLGLDFYCFHDRDVAPEGRTVKDTNKNLWTVVKRFKQLQKDTGIKLLWGTANMFSHPRFTQGASTSPSADIFAYCANSVKEMLDVSKELGGENYVFWGGREGYISLLNTDMGREADHAAAFFQMAVDYAKKIGFKGQFLIEPKPAEPSKHQYDFDTATVLAFLRKYKLDKKFKMNIEANHATLAGHDFVHELELARVNGALGSIDANRGDLMNGWDTDQFPNDIKEWAHAAYIIIKNKGLGSGGLNFDAKVRRDSLDVEDFFHAHIGAVDVIARAFRIAGAMWHDKVFEKNLKSRYGSYDTGIGKKIESGKADFESLQKYILKKGTPDPIESGKVEYLENVFNRYM